MSLTPEDVAAQIGRLSEQVHTLTDEVRGLRDDSTKAGTVIASEIARLAVEVARLVTARKRR